MNKQAINPETSLLDYYEKVSHCKKRAASTVDAAEKSEYLKIAQAAQKEIDKLICASQGSISQPGQLIRII